MKNIVLVVLIFPISALAQAGFNQNGCTGAASNYVYAKGGCQSPVTATVGNGVLYATNYSGADMGEKISAALSAAYTAGGGIVDATGFTCPASCHIGTANLTVGDGTHGVVLMLPAGVIARDTIPATGKSAQILYNSYSTIRGQGVGVTVISGHSDVTAIQQANNSAGVHAANMSDLSITDNGTVFSGSAAFMVGGPNADGSTGQDVLSSTFQNIIASGADIGVLVKGQHGCICYDKFYNVSGTGASFGVKTTNDSGYSGSFNSSQWYGGRFSGPIGLYNWGSGKVSFFGPSMESNTSPTGAVLAAQATNDNLGTGYVVGDSVTPSAGCTVNPTLTVNSVAAGGSVGAQGHPGLTVSDGGSGCPTYVSSASVTGGSGTGLKVNLQTSAAMVLIAQATMMFNPYEEASAPDWICGTGNFVLGTFQGGDGTQFSQSYGHYHLCPGTSNGYGGPASNMIWGPSATPPTIGVLNGIMLNSPNMYNDTGSRESWTTGSGVPSGSCVNGSLYTDHSAGKLYVCESGAWVAK